MIMLDSSVGKEGRKNF